MIVPKLGTNVPSSGTWTGFVVTDGHREIVLLGVNAVEAQQIANVIGLLPVGRKVIPLRCPQFVVRAATRDRKLRRVDVILPLDDDDQKWTDTPFERKGRR